MRNRPLPHAAALVSLALAVPLWAACGSGSPSSSGGSGGGAALGPSSESVCQQLNGVLSDGPDPGADPVGYALSQILPLTHVHGADARVAATVEGLIAADRALVASKGADAAASKAIAADDASLNRVCPGVAP
jgi:hypothetical protein